MILITGSSGFIGMNLCRRLKSDGHQVVGFDRIENEEVKTYLGDISDYLALKKVFDENKIDFVVHLAGVSSIRSIGDVNEYVKGNINGVLNVLELCKDNDIKRFILASTSAVYGKKNTPFSEDIRTDPISLYGITKRGGESMCLSYYERFNLKSVCLRFFTVYGEGGRRDMAIPTFIRSILNEDEIKIFGDGNQKRDYIHISDVIESIISSINCKSDFEILNIGSGQGTSLLDLIKIIEEKVGRRAKSVNIPNPKDEEYDTQADIQKAKRVLGWEPKKTLSDGIEGFIKWQKESN